MFNLLEKIMDREVVVNIIPAPRTGGRGVELWFEYATAKPNSCQLLSDIHYGQPDVWTAVHITNGELLLYVTNGRVVTFIYHNPNNVGGAYRMGPIKTTIGVVDVKGGWSSRSGVVFKYTGQALVPIVVDSSIVYIALKAAETLAKYLDLKIIEKISSHNGESNWMFSK